MLLWLSFILFTPIEAQPDASTITFFVQEKNVCTKEITINFTLVDADFIYKDFLNCSIDHPAVTLSSWKSNKQSITYYDSSFKQAKQVFNEDFTITITATTQKPLTESLYLYVSYYRNSDKKINDILIPLYFTAIPSGNTEHEINLAETINSNVFPLIKKRITYLDNYLSTITYVSSNILISLRTDHKKYFALLIFTILVLLTFSYFFKKELINQIKIKESIEIITSLLILISIAYLLLSVYATYTKFITTIAWTCSLYTGLYYIKKSETLQSQRLRNFCTIVGIACFCSVIFLSFKIFQYTDEIFHLL